MSCTLMLLDFDHHATTPLAPQVWEAMLPYFGSEYGNPSSISHRRGLKAAQVELSCRERVAQLLHVEPREIIWTSGATEANNLAIQGVLRAAGSERGLVTSAAEHRSVLDPARRMKREGWPVTILGVDSRGLVDVEELSQAINPQTALVSVIWANNEIGTISPMAEIARICRERNVWLHSDATQAVGKIPVEPGKTGVELLSFSGHKLYGPPGIGVLVIRRERGPIPIQPLIEGGGQQNGLRSGTLPLPLIVGLTEALELCEKTRVEEAVRMAALRDQLWIQLSTAIPGLVRHTPVSNPDSRHPLPGSLSPGQWEEKLDIVEVLPHNLSVGIPGVDGDALLVRLRETELCVSSGAACSSSNREPSHVLTAIGVPGPLARASLRFGLGRATTLADVTRAVGIVAETVRALRTSS